jgi:hypothetical protein
MNRIPLIASQGVAAPSRETSVQNRFNPSGGAAANTVYDNATGAVSALQAFGTSGKSSRADGQVITYSLAACDPAWELNPGIYKWDGSDAYVGYQTAGVNNSADGRTVTYTSVGDGTDAVNVKYTVNGVYSPTNVIPAGAFDAMLASITRTQSNLACCFVAVGASNTEPTPTILPDLDGKLLYVLNGATRLTRTALSGSLDMVARATEQPATYDQNELLQYTSYVAIDNTTTSAETVGAFADNYSPTPSNPNTWIIESDDAAAHQMGSASPIYLGANHGTPSRRVLATAHGKTNSARGNIYSQGGNQFQLTRIIDANYLLFTSVVTGADDLWTFVPQSITAGSLTYVSGPVAGNITVTSSTFDQVYPMNQGVEITTSLGGAPLTESGAYEARVVRTRTSYRIPNIKDVQRYITDNIGNTADILYNDPSIDSQVGFVLNTLETPSGARTVYYQRTAIQSYYCAFMWPSQHQTLNPIPANSETVWTFIEGVNAFESGINQNEGTPLAFSSVVNTTSNTLEYYARNTTWVSGSYWADGQQHAPTLTMLEIRNSGGTPIKRLVIVNDDAEGRSSVPGFSAITCFRSGAGKIYPAVDYARTVPQGETDMTIGAWGVVDPAYDPQSIVNFIYLKNGGVYGFRWNTLNTLTNYDIPIPSYLEGFKLRIVNGKRAASVTIQTTTVTSGAIRVSTTGPGGFSAEFYRG